MRGWASERGLLQHEEPTTDKQLAFVRDFDLAYAERRLQSYSRASAGSTATSATKASPLASSSTQ
jgi:hypothetical protein